MLLWYIALSLWATDVETQPTRPASAVYHVAPGGTPRGDGSAQAPWDIASALRGDHEVPPGTVIVLEEGTYRRRPQELFEVRLRGTKERPITIRPAPGAHVRIDGGLSIQPPSAHLLIRDLEIFVSEPNPASPVERGSHPAGFTRPHGGVNVYGGEDIRLVNLVVHHCRQGFSLWAGARDVELYGCLIYDNGWWGEDRGHGHAIYTQNKEGIKRIANCVIVGGFGYSVHAYGSRRAYVDHYRIENNIVYDAGPFLVGGGRPSKDILVRNNLLYRVSMRIGYNAPYNVDCRVIENLIWKGNLEVVRYRQAELVRNRVIEGRVALPETTVSTQINMAGSEPKAPEVHVIPNSYDPGRAYIAVFNWPRAVAAQANVEGILRDGEAFVLKSPRHLYGEPEHWGVCENGRILLPLYRREFAAWILLRQ